MWARLRSFFVALTRRSRLESDLEAELQAHLEERADDLERGGLSRTEALRQARLEFGALESYKDRCREQRGLRWPDELRQDLRYALRMFRRSPGVIAIALLSLALGIGANTAIFSILNSLLLTNLPIRDPARLVNLQMTRGALRGSVSYPLYQRLRAGISGRLAEDVCATTAIRVAAVAAPGADPLPAVIENVSANYFDVLGVRLIQGQAFGPAEEKIGAAQVAVIGERFWRSRLASDPAIVGKTVLVDEKPATVLGIAGAEFTGVEVGRSVDLWTNVTSDPEHLTRMGWNFLRVFARLHPAASRLETQAAVDTIFENFHRDQLAEDHNSERRRQTAAQEHIVVESGSTGTSGLRERFALPLRIVMGVVALVLLIACANITNLLLARAAARQREIATRLSLGAGRARLFRQFLTESLLLSLCGGLLGLAVAAWTARHLLGLMPQGRIPLALDVHLSLRVLLFTSAVSIAAGLLFGIVPAMRAGRTSVTAALKLTGGGPRFGNLLSIAQIALSTMLVFGAGLFVRTLVNLKNVDAGFHLEHVVTFGVGMPRAYSEQQKAAAERSIVERVRALPGVAGASIGWPGVFAGGGFTGNFRIPGVEVPQDLQHDLNIVLIGPDFFSVLGTPLLAGRAFDARDAAPTPVASGIAVNASGVTVAIVNESLARTYFPGRNPVGMKIQPFPSSPQPVIAEIVGVVRDIRHNGLRNSAAPSLYLPIDEMEAPWGPNFTLRLGKELASVSPEIQRAVSAIDPRLKVEEVETMDQQIDAYLQRERLLAAIAGLFSGLALLLAAVGLYGVMAYAVARRTSEIGLRMALGAQRRQVLDMILLSGVRTALIGVALGVPAALALSRLLSTLLFAVKPLDAASLAVPLAIMLAVAVAAVWLPAWRAANVDPLTALRQE